MGHVGLLGAGFLAAAALVSVLPASAENLIPNSGFLRYANPGIPNCWTACGVQKKLADWPGCWRPDDDTALPGLKSMRLSNPEARGLSLETSYLWGFTKGRNYTWSVYLKTDAPGGTVKAYLVGLGSEKEPTKWTSVKPTSEWQRYSETGLITDAFTGHGVWHLTWEGRGTLWVCAPQMEEGTEPTAYASAPVDVPKTSGQAVAAPAKSVNAPLPESGCPVLSAAPQVDGKLDDACWANAARFSGFVQLASTSPAAAVTEVMVGRTADALFLGIRCQEPNMAGLVAKMKGDKDVSVFADDEVEVFVSAHADGSDYRQFALSVAGGRYDGANRDGLWNGPWQSATVREATAWTAEIAIPFTSLAYGPEVGDTWRLNVCRYRPQAPEEYSSWSAVFNGFHDPERFGKLQGMGAADLRKWQAAIAAFTERDDKVSVTFWSAIAQSATVELLTEKGAAAAAVSTQLSAGTTVVDLGPRVAVEGGLARVRVADTAGVTLAAGEFALSEVATPLQAWLTRSYYVDPENVKVVAYTPVPKARVRVTSASRPLVECESPPDALGWAEIAVPLAGRGPGTYALEISLVDGSGKAVAETRLMAAVQAPGAHMVPWDPSSGCLIVDDKPYLPIAIGGGGATVDMVKDSASVGFNSIHVWFHNPRKWPDPADSAEVRAVLDECQKLGLSVIPANTVSPKTFATFAEWKVQSLANLTQFKDHPVMLAWDIIDEPSPSWARDPDWKESNLQELHDACKALDPWRPVFVNYWTWKPGYGYYGGLNSTDIYSIDCYNLSGMCGCPVRNPYRTYEDAMVSQVKQYRDMDRDARRDGKPAHFWLHYYAGGDSYKEPSVQENIGQTWLALVHGFRMVSYFIYRPMSNDLWQSMKPLTAEISSLAPVLGTPELPGVVASGSSAIHCAAFRHAGNWYVLTVNATDAAVDAKLALSVPTRGKADVLFEGRKVEVRGAALADRWEPAARHVYRIAQK
ncbi:MAG: hypothetical protein A3K19_32500 [Lentisphaerae bacterium RIFOXYB12_FULL_65_16]|nr:MAG: hypothetical protein A3K18_08065 [Lentisphaerae bacterium RIFOXYA12_64_32]OGV84418.1 MAG: hypothetical protein A3K19_32500 [Lentisphaerae bacterium RIFOXYB12_FULL_65_16]